VKSGGLCSVLSAREGLISHSESGSAELAEQHAGDFCRDQRTLDGTNPPSVHRHKVLAVNWLLFVR
jgi:hypothetical protein